MVDRRLTSSATAASAPSRPCRRHGPFLQHERRGHALGDDGAVRLGRLLRPDRDLADVDDAGELADLVEERRRGCGTCPRPAACTESRRTASAGRPCPAGTRWIARFDLVASVWMRRRVSATSFSSGSTWRRFSSRSSSSVTCAWNCGSCLAVASPLAMSARIAVSRVWRISMSACDFRDVEVPEAEHRPRRHQRRRRRSARTREVC